MIFQREVAKTQRKEPIQIRLFATLRLRAKFICYVFTKFLKRAISVISSLSICVVLTSLSAQENSTLLNRAASLFQKEKMEIKNYKVHQEVISKIKETSITVVESRIQTGYFKSPEEYIFVVKEIDLNGIKQILSKPIVERTYKSEIDWLSKEGFSTHFFQMLSADASIVKYLVSPLKIQSGYYRGQLWLNSQNGKIVKILKEPIIKKREMMKYSLVLDFEKDFPYQAPSRTLLKAFYQVENRSTEIEVEVKFQDYKFNLDINNELSK